MNFWRFSSKKQPNYCILPDKKVDQIKKDTTFWQKDNFCPDFLDAF